MKINMRKYLIKIFDIELLTTKEAVQQGLIWVGFSVCLHFWNSILISSPSQSEHCLRLTNQSEDSIWSAVSAEITV